jgi:hypothetical protein
VSAMGNPLLSDSMAASSPVFRIPLVSRSYSKVLQLDIGIRCCGRVWETLRRFVILPVGVNLNTVPLLSDPPAMVVP